jgi:hypothetical protein
MGKAERVRAHSARQRIAAQQAAARRAEGRRRVLIAGGGVMVVLALLAVIIVVRLAQSPAQATSAVASDPTAARAIATVPAAALDTAGAGTSPGLRAIAGQPELTADGKPELLYIGAEYCPFCAAERWAIAVAVSRFGTLSGLHFIHSSPDDVYPSTPTLSFYRSGYASRYLAFAPVEWFGEQEDPATPFGHVYLQHPSPGEAALFARYAGGAVPFIDIGNRYLVPGVQYQPSDLAGLTWAQIAAELRDPGSTVGRDIDGAANRITAAICTLTRGQPGGVCSSAGVTAARADLTG